MILSIDVVVPTYNGWELTRSCLEHLGHQTRQHNVIVVDNASTDGTPQRLRAAFPEARLVELDANRGFSTACNRGVKAVEPTSSSCSTTMSTALPTSSNASSRRSRPTNGSDRPLRFSCSRMGSRSTAWDSQRTRPWRVFLGYVASRSATPGASAGTHRAGGCGRRVSQERLGPGRRPRRGRVHVRRGSRACPSSPRCRLGFFTRPRRGCDPSRLGINRAPDQQAAASQRIRARVFPTAIRCPSYSRGCPRACDRGDRGFRRCRAFAGSRGVTRASRRLADGGGAAPAAGTPT